MAARLSDCCQPALPADARVLLLGAAPAEALELWPQAQREPPDASPSPRFDLALLVGPEALGQGESWIARARDQWASQVLVLLPGARADHDTEQAYFALGFSRRALPHSLIDKYVAFGFSLSRYKHTPDWLNAKYWANPERWNKN